MNRLSLIRTRFAPSPTGALHIGGLRTCVYAYALARHEDGNFILRIEDTDQKRKVPGAVENLEKILKTFGITWDEYYVQSDRVKTGIYKKAAEKLIEDENAFYCQCEAKNAKKEGYSKELRDPCRDKKLTSGAIKLKIPDGQIIGYHDYILDKYIEWNTSSVADTTLLKSDGFPTYHLAVVVDDTDMKISHILRGHDWMPSTPIHLLVYKFLDYKMPELGHLTDIQDPDGGKLSKRKGSVSCEAMIVEGYLPEAILNFILLLGWAPKDNREIFSLSDFINLFDPDGFQKSNPVFNRIKLDWFNGYYLRNTNNDKLAVMINDFYKNIFDEKLLQKTIPLVKDRITKLSDYKEIAGFFYETPDVDGKILGDNAHEHLQSALNVISKVSEWNLDAINNNLMDEIKNKGYKTGAFFMDLRIAITGKKFTPPINESIEILGKDTAIERIQRAIGK